MNAFVYTRTVSFDNRTPKPDRRQAQIKRCREYLQFNRIKVVRTFSDQGNVHPVHLLPDLRKLLKELDRSNKRHFVVADHPARLGNTKDLQEMVIRKIEDGGGSFIWPKPNYRYHGRRSNMPNLVEEIILQALKHMEK